MPHLVTNLSASLPNSDGRDQAHTAYQAPDLKDSDRNKVCPFQREKGIELAPERLRRSSGDEECRAIPANVFETLKFVGDGGNGGCYDCLVMLSEDFAEAQDELRYYLRSRGTPTMVQLVPCFDRVSRWATRTKKIARTRPTSTKTNLVFVS